jgi:outer membrane protein
MNYPKATSFVLVALIFLSGPAVAQKRPALSQTKIGLVNVERILRDSPTAKRVQTTLQEEFAVRDQEIGEMAGKMKVMQAYLEKNALTLSGEERQTRERDIEETNRDLMRKQRAFNEDFTQRREQALAGLFDRITRAVRALAELEKFDIVVREVVWVSTHVDITDKIIVAIDEKDDR